MEEKVEKISSYIKDVITALAAERGVELPLTFDIAMERPRREGQGDLSTNAAMKLTKIFSMPPMDLACEIAHRAEGSCDIEKIEAARPGFINITLSNSWIEETIEHILKKGADYGRNNEGANKKVQVEFVSANPTGPIHLGHGRGAAVGDVMSAILTFSGWNVSREYYINDAGLQMEKLALSVRSRYFALFGREKEAPFPEDGYPGDYIDAIAQKIADERGDTLTSVAVNDAVVDFKTIACAEILKMIRKDLSDFGVEFDVWFSEASLYEGDTVSRTIEKLRANSYAFDSDGAVWFRSTAFGDDKDRVMIKQGGVPTYFTSDVAYLQNKYDRGFERLIYVWGADHHGYIPRMRSINSALGFDDAKMEFLLIQFVSLLRNGVPVAMSKRAGTFVTLREVMDEVGSDAARFSFVNRRCDSHLDFDLEVAKQTSNDNPVYYVQYAHARICSIISGAGDSMPNDDDSVDLTLLREPSEIRLVKEMSKFPEEVAKAARYLEPHRITNYATSLAEAFHGFYNSEKVLTDDPELTAARLKLTTAAGVVIKNTLRLLGISAPERM